MKIALLTTQPVPKTYGGMDRLIGGLAEALRRRHPTDLIELPVDERSAEGVMRGYYDFFQLDLGKYDLAISTKAPSYMARHPLHLLYLPHRMRVFYDRWDPVAVGQVRLRRLIHWMDNWAMDAERIARIFTIGRTVSRRLLKWGGIESTPLRPPTTFEPAPPRPGEYFFAAGRLHAWKRFDLTIRAMQRSRTDFPLLIAGTGPEENRLRELAAGDERIRFLGHLDEAQLREAYAASLAAIFTPIDEDLGYITFESFLSGKPVLTTRDAGEPAEIVVDGASGFIAEPTPEALAERIDWLAEHPAEAETMGRAGRAAALEPTWDRVAETLLGAVDEIVRANRSGAGVARVKAMHEARGADKIRLLVTDNQMIDPPIGGGRIRIWQLYRNLPDDFVTTYIGAHDHPGPLFRDRWLAPNFREIVMPLTIVHFKAHEIWRRLTGGDATIDVTIPLLLGRFSPRYARLIRQYLPWADALVCAHPWMFPFLPEANGLPRVYDSQNCEACVKGELLRRTMAGRYLARRVTATERRAVAGSRLTLACSEADADQFVARYGADRARVLLVPNGVDCEAIRPAADPAEKTAARRRLGLPGRPLAIFTGSNYEPNLNAARFLIDALAPSLPDFTFGIVGGVGPMWRERFPDATPPLNVRLFGFVSAEDLAAIYRAADFGLNPMTQGSGTNIKLLDYMAAGLAIVTSPVGARGIDGRDGEHWRLAPPENFGAALRELAAAPERAGALAERARALAETRYDWRAIAARLADALRELVRADRLGSARGERPQP